MTQEEKSLILRDICGRLPYGITIYRITDNSTHRIQYSDITENIDQFSHFLECSGVDNIKPYLRPMSSMTDKEKAYYFAIDEEPVSCIDWLNKHHFDYRGLIEKGLALEAPEDIYKI
jgi:hypothetical protein